MAAAVGTTTAWRPIMRAILACLLLGGCVGAGIGPSAGTGTRPGVMPMLSELPNDATKRDAILDSAANTAGPEQRSGLTTKEQAAETVGATAAAILGSLFSKTKNVSLGAATKLDEGPVGVRHPGAPSADPTGAADRDAPPADADASNADLIPWIKLH
jgi:hypothetical protein